MDRKLRPSSAWRASKPNIMKLISPAAAAGSRMTVYLPGSRALASAEPLALLTATWIASLVSNLFTSSTLRVTQPEPLPSLVRTVQV